jgi:oxygen-independent coproporphyrinogen-3 oxidase
MTPELLQFYARPVPRYTSYPTAPHFSDSIGAESYESWLAALPAGASLSLYVHVPFCDTLCWFCGCHTKITRRYEPVADYLGALKREIASIAARVDSGCRVRHIHWGGGSPTILESGDLAGLAGTLFECFTLAEGAEFAVEIDPRGLTARQLDALATSGLTRASIGIQDFDAQVQKAINRIQPYEETRDVIEGLRERGVGAINVDLMYGLPEQNESRIGATIEKVMTLAPDRISLFGYAHVPWMKRHQEMIPQSSLPDVAARYAQAEFAARQLVEAGYMRIGLDHFARPRDPLAIAAAGGTMRRNFQGYTTDTADALLGFGASAIGRLPQGFVQNHVPIAEYQRAVTDGKMAAVRGYAFQGDDLRRGTLIERLMCDLKLSWPGLETLIGDCDDLRRESAEALRQFEKDGLIELGGDGFEVTEEGRTFVRSICAAFDAYLQGSAARHSMAV